MKRMFISRWAALIVACAMTVGAKAEVKASGMTISPASQKYDGVVSVTIDASEAFTVDGTTTAATGMRYKNGTRAYTKAEMTSGRLANGTSANLTEKKQSSYTWTVSGSNTRVVTAIAYYVNGKDTTFTDIVTATYTYEAAATKKATTLKAEAVSVATGSQVAVTPTLTDEDGTTMSGATLSYAVDDESIATVDASGNVTGVAAGNTTLTITYAGDANYTGCTTSVNVTVTSSETSADVVYTSIAAFRHAGSRNPKTDDMVLQFSEQNPATVVAVLTANEWGNEGAGSAFIVDNSGYGLWIPSGRSDVEDLLKLDGLASVGSQITGSLVCQYYNNRTSRMAEITKAKENAKKTIDGTEYKNFALTITAGAVSEEDLPLNEISDVNFLNTVTGNTTDGTATADGNSYDAYLNTLCEIPGVIRQHGNEYYLVENESAAYDSDNSKNRIYISMNQMGDDIDLADYVGSSGVFKGLLIKRNNTELKLTVTQADFLSVKKLYISELDDENRIYMMGLSGNLSEALDTVYVHRNNVVLYEGYWNNICLPFDCTADEFAAAFGTELKEAATVGSISGGKVNYETLSEPCIKAGEPMLIKVSKSVADVNDETQTGYWRAFVNKTIDEIKPKEYEGTHSNKVVNGQYYVKGLYGKKLYTDPMNGDSTKLTADDATTQKYQYASVKDNKLHYYNAGTGLGLKGLRIYFYFPNWDSKANNEAVERKSGSSSSSNVMITVDEEEMEATGINGTTVLTERGTGSVYNLNGQCMGTSTTGLPAGVYVKNGKKFIVE